MDGNNSQAANELGVMLARRGRVNEAHNVFVQAAQVRPDPATLNNLAVVQQHLGDTTSAQLTSQRAAALAASDPHRYSSQRLGGIQWVDNATFGKLGNQELSVASMYPAASNSVPQTLEPTPAPTVAKPTRPPVAPSPARTASRRKSGVWDF